jgi:predicted metalloprotease with PDZ domain
MHIKYHISFKNLFTHLLFVDLTIENIEDEFIELKLPVWIPGSYLIREFAKNINYLFDVGKNKRIKKISKNTWRIDTSERKSVHIQYSVYGFEWSVRTNFINEESAFINCAATFLYIKNHTQIPINIQIEKAQHWQTINSNLDAVNENKWHRKVNNIDELYDSVINIGNPNVYFFDAENTAYELALYGKNNCNPKILIDDLKKIIGEQTQIFGTNPCSKYLFIIQHNSKSFGGLEHENCSVNHIPSNHYDEREKYLQAISLLSHEHFHLWNVKRIKPKELIPYQYEHENYTELLWFFEGITSYYDDLCCYRAGVFSQEEYFFILEKTLNEVTNNAGNDTQTLAESSFDTWIKYYRQNENSINSEVSYYKKGSVIALLIDVMLIYYSDTQYCLDDVMQTLFHDTLNQNYGGLTKEKIISTLHQFVQYDWTNFYENYIEDVTELPIENNLKNIGIQLRNHKPSGIYLGISINKINNIFSIKQLDKNFGAYQAGLQVHDIIEEINQIEFDGNLDNILLEKNIDDILDFKINRDGNILNIPVRASIDNRKKYKIEINTQNKLIAKWLKIKS